MAARANWKGLLRVGEVSCPVALYTAASTAERIAFHILNRKTGHRVHREFVDAETGERVEAKEQVKGYETGPGDYIAFEPGQVWPGRLRLCRGLRRGSRPWLRLAFCRPSTQRPPRSDPGHGGGLEDLRLAVS